MNLSVQRISIQQAQSNPLFQRLFEIPDPPSEIFIEGKPEALESLLSRLPQDCLAVVGTRIPQPRSLALLRESILSLAGSPLIILSGLAKGIDTHAHAVALEAGLPTIAVLGCGLDQTYPRENETLRRQIVHQGGLIISEFPPSSPIRKHHFLRRNRLLAGWSKATWVVEAAARSGALNTARWAREYHRSCFAVPCFPGDKTLAGNQILLNRDHALPFWDSTSLGAEWLDLATHVGQPTLSLFQETSQAGDPASSPLIGPDLSRLVQKVGQLHRQKGGATLDEIWEWTTQLGWSREHFFVILHRAKEKNLLKEHWGTLISI